MKSKLLSAVALTAGLTASCSGGGEMTPVTHVETEVSTSTLTPESIAHETERAKFSTMLDQMNSIIQTAENPQLIEVAQFFVDNAVLSTYEASEGFIRAFRPIDRGEITGDQFMILIVSEADVPQLIELDQFLTTSGGSYNPLHKAMLINGSPLIGDETRLSSAIHEGVHARDDILSKKDVIGPVPTSPCPVREEAAFTIQARLYEHLNPVAMTKFYELTTGRVVEVYDESGVVLDIIDPVDGDVADLELDALRSPASQFEQNITIEVLLISAFANHTRDEPARNDQYFVDYCNHEQ